MTTFPIWIMDPKVDTHVKEKVDKFDKSRFDKIDDLLLIWSIPEAFLMSKVLMILSIPSSSVNDYVAHIYSKYMDLDGNNSTCRPGWKEVVQYD